MPDLDDDTVDKLVIEWERERPDLNFAPLRVLSRVWRISRSLDRARRASFDESDLEVWEFDVLAALRRAGSPFELAPKDLLEQNLVSSGTMTNRIDRMASRGLVERRTDPRDGRGILVRMTASGLAQVDSAITDLLVAERELLAGLTPTEQDRLATLLKKLGTGLS